MMPSLSDSKGQPVRVGATLGSGGEGAVHEVVGRPDMAAKIYHEPISVERAQKIAIMAGRVSQDLRRMTAWPAELIFADGGLPTGFLMPKVDGHKDVHKLYSPKSRKAEFPAADFKFLVHAAANVARAFATVHDAQCVIGDVNHGGITVAQDATVKLIDCDSFQVSANGRTYLCEVGVPTFTPPELQGRPFRGVVRTANHDNFGLAVILFHLLFLGRHPFAGRYLGRGDMPIETAIQQFRFAYGATSKQAQMEPPPHVPSLMTMSPTITSLFERAFSKAGANSTLRPQATEWITALAELNKQLARCKNEQNDLYPSTVSSCPWCQVEAATGAVLFSVLVLPRTQPHLFDIVTVWRTIDSIQLSPPPRVPTEKDLGPRQPSREAVQLRTRSRTWKWCTRVTPFAIGIAALLLCGAAPNLWLLWLLGGWGLHSLISRIADKQPFAKFDSALLTAEAQHRAAHQRYVDFSRSNFGAVGKFWKKKKQLETLREEWNSLPGRRQRRVQELDNDRQRQQLEKFLGNFFIEHANIPGIGPGRKATLESYGIETAADVTKKKVRAVPGFGPAMAEKLIEWRRKTEQKFQFDPSQGVDPQQIAAVDRDILKDKGRLEQSLQAGATELLQTKRQIEKQHATLRRELEDALQRLAQARADQRAAAA